MRIFDVPRCFARLHAFGSGSGGAPKPTGAPGRCSRQRELQQRTRARSKTWRTRSFAEEWEVRFSPPVGIQGRAGKVVGAQHQGNLGLVTTHPLRGLVAVRRGPARLAIRRGATSEPLCTEGKLRRAGTHPGDVDGDHAELERAADGRRRQKRG